MAFRWHSSRLPCSVPTMNLCAPPKHFVFGKQHPTCPPLPRHCTCTCRLSSLQARQCARLLSAKATPEQHNSLHRRFFVSAFVGSQVELRRRLQLQSSVATRIKSFCSAPGTLLCGPSGGTVIEADSAQQRLGAALGQRQRLNRLPKPPRVPPASSSVSSGQVPTNTEADAGSPAAVYPSRRKQLTDYRHVYKCMILACF